MLRIGPLPIQAARAAAIVRPSMADALTVISFFDALFLSSPNRLLLMTCIVDDGFSDVGFETGSEETGAFNA